MPYQFEPYSAVDGLLLADCLVDQYARAGQDIIGGKLMPLPSAGRQTVSADGANDRVAIFGVRQADNVVVLFGGVRHAALGAAVDLSYGTRPNENPGNGENVCLANVTLRAGQSLAPLNLATASNVCVAGYSGGAVCAAYFGGVVRDLAPRSSVSVVQFNPPRTAVREWRDRVPPFEMIRWHCSDDPVQMLPLHIGESAVSDAFGPRAALDIQTRFNHHGKGVAIDRTGVSTFLDVEQVVIPADDPYPRIAAWATGTDERAVEAHSISELRRRLGMVVVAFGNTRIDFGINRGLPSFSNTRPGVLVEPVAPQGVPSAADSGYVGPHSLDQVVADWVNPVNIASSKVGDATRKRFYAQKISKKWYVMYFGRPVMGPCTKSFARRDASRLNTLVSHGKVEALTMPFVVGESLAIEMSSD